MAYIDVRDNQTSKKFSLIRLKPARWLNDDLTDNGDGTYSVTLSGLIIAFVEENGAQLTLSTSTLSAGEYSFTENTGVLTVYPNAAPSSTNAIVGFHYLFYTSQRIRTAGENPEDTTTTTRNWLPRVESSPQIEQSILNIEEGFFEISSSNIVLINDNGEFYSYLKDNDSFYNKEVRVWFCIDSVSNIQKSFRGIITNLNLTSRQVTLEIEDNLSRVSLPATMGDGRKYTYWGTADYASMYREQAGTFIPFFFGRTSRYKTLSDSKSDLPDAIKLDYESLYNAVCTNYSTTINGSNNRVWGLGRVSSYGLEQNIHSVQTSYHGSSNYTRFTIATHSSIFVGDTGSAIGSPNAQARVILVDSDNSFIYTTKLSAQNYSSLTFNGVSIVVNQTTVNYYPIEGRDYTILTETTDASNSYVYIQFINSFETNLSGMSFLDPSSHTVSFRIKPKHEQATHGKVLKYMLDKVGGLTSNATSFDTADTNLVSNVAFSVPNFDEADFNNYTKYFGDLLSSTFGYLRLNNSFEVEYKLFETPADSTSITQYDIILDEYSVEIDYKDIVDEIIAFNPHYSSVDHESTSGVSTKEIRTKYLHGIDKTIRFRHVLESMSTRLTSIFNSRKERKAKYFLTTKTKNLDTIIGEDFNLTYKIISGDSTRSMKIVSLNKGPGAAEIILDDYMSV